MVLRREREEGDVIVIGKLEGDVGGSSSALEALAVLGFKCPTNERHAAPFFHGSF